MKLPALFVLPLVGAAWFTTLMAGETELTALATSEKPATVAIQEATPSDQPDGGVVYLTLELKTLREDGKTPFALDVSVLPCATCEGDEGVYRLGPLSIFPAPHVGERRVVEIALEASALPPSAEYVSVSITPLVQDRPVANSAVEILSAKLHSGSS